MKTFIIRTISGNSTLFSGRFSTFHDCLKTAIDDHVPLHYADLRGLNLSNVELDGADLRHAGFTGSNLSGANLSEALLDGANFSGATLFGAVLCESSLRGAFFQDALFGGTDIGHSDLSDTAFSTFSAFDLRFEETRAQTGCRFINGCGTICPMNRPPLVIRGVGRPVIVMDRHIKIGSTVHDITALSGLRFHGIVPPHHLRVMLEKTIRLYGPDSPARHPGQATAT